MPGTDYLDSTQLVVGEVAELPHLVELPRRGPTAAMVGRTLALVSGLGAELQPSSWRLTPATGTDQRRARSLLSHDLDIAEELLQGYRGRFKLQITGPCTLAAAVELPRGDKALSDAGARKELTSALAEGAREHVEAVQRRLPDTQIVVQLDEPGLPAVLAGSVPTASGFSRHRAVAPPEAMRSLDEVLDAVAAVGADTVLHCCAADVPFSLLSDTSAQAASFDVSLIPAEAYDELGGWVDAGRDVWLGVVPSVDPADVPSDADITKLTLGWWSRLGYDDLDTLPATTITPTCGLANASPGWARAALELCSRVARNLSAEQDKMD